MSLSGKWVDSSYYFFTNVMVRFLTRYKSFIISRNSLDRIISPIITPVKYNQNWHHGSADCAGTPPWKATQNVSPSYIALQINTYIWPGPYSDDKLQLITFICCHLCEVPTWLSSMSELLVLQSETGKKHAGLTMIWFCQSEWLTIFSGN